MPHRDRSALVLCYGLLILLIRAAAAADFTTARVAVYFSPNGGAMEAVVPFATEGEAQQAGYRRAKDCS
jgi:hypothetical protein